MSEDPPGDFDYGDKKEDGQYENHPTIDEGDFVQEVRKKYVHEECGSSTTMSSDIARSVARDPDYYSKTFCKSCGDYFDVDEFHWAKDGKPWKIDDE